MRRLAPLVFCGLLAAMPAAPAEPARWTTLGPDTPATVTGLAFDPQHPEIAYAGLDGGGAARSADGGRSWRTSSAGLTDPALAELTTHPRQSGLVYGLDGGAHLVRSRDGGQTWNRLPPPFPPLAETPVRALALVPGDPRLLYAGTDTGLFASRDQGDHWSRLPGRGLPAGFRVIALAVDALDPQLLYAGIAGTGSGGNSGFWVSADGGRSWERRRRTVPGRLVADPRRTGTLYFLGASVERSRDRGATWERYFGRRAFDLVFDPRHPETAYARGATDPADEQPAALYRTTDDGRHWTALSTGLPTQFFSSALAVAPAGPLLLGTGHAGLFRSEDLGATWSPAGAGLVNSVVLALAFGSPGTLFAGTPQGLYRSRDDGATWTRVLAGPQLGTLAVDRRSPETVYAGALAPFGRDPRIVWKTTDGGDTWTPLPHPRPDDPASGLRAADLAVDPTDSRVVFLATAATGFGSSTGAGVYRSADGGETWTATSLPEASFEALAVDPGRPARPGTVWALFLFGLYRSADSGQSWSLLLPGLPADVGSILRAMAVAPSDPDALWVAGDHATWRSMDGGATWRRLPGVVAPPYQPFLDAVHHPLAVDPADPSSLYLAWTNGVSRRAPGTGWQSLDAGLFNRDATTLEFDPYDPRRLLVGTAGAGAGAFASRSAPPP